MEDLGALGTNGSAAKAVSADGTVVVGMSKDTAGRERAFFWTKTDGMTDLGTLGGDDSDAVAISADGGRIAGFAQTAMGGMFAVIWNAKPACGGLASTSVRNGSGLNPLTLNALNAPVLGSTWDVELDCGAHLPGAAFLVGFQAPASGGVFGYGEVLLDLTSAPYFILSSAHAMGKVGYSIAIPNDASLCGLSGSFQGLCRGAPGARLSNALDAYIGG